MGGTVNYMSVIGTPPEHVLHSRRKAGRAGKERKRKKRKGRCCSKSWRWGYGCLLVELVGGKGWAELGDDDDIRIKRKAASSIALFPLHVYCETRNTIDLSTLPSLLLFGKTRTRHGSSYS